LANSFEVNEPMLGRNATGGSITIIERLRRSRRRLFGTTFVGKSEVTPNKNIIKDLGAPPPRKEELQKVGAPR
jgi:hypothetical protein